MRLPSPDNIASPHDCHAYGETDERCDEADVERVDGTQRSNVDGTVDDVEDEAGCLEEEVDADYDERLADIRLPEEFFELALLLVP